MNFTAWSDGRFELGRLRTRCVLGRGGVIAAADKREGDGATPLGIWPIRRWLYRPDRWPAPPTLIPASPIDPDDGWCDAPDDPAYNRPVKLPYASSAEALWRQDGVYDLIGVLGHNDDPPVPDLGSAIFLHITAEDDRPTQGCVALSRADLQALAAIAAPGSAIAVRL